MVVLAFLGILWREIVLGLGLATIGGTVALLTLIVLVFGAKLFSPAEPIRYYPPAQRVSFDQFARIAMPAVGAQTIR